MRVWTGFIWLRTGPVVDSCEQSNEPSSSIKGRDFLELSVLRKGSAACS
jgi:hypothetical protein